jgi:hypothetical protein
MPAARKDRWSLCGGVVEAVDTRKKNNGKKCGV